MKSPEWFAMQRQHCLAALAECDRSHTEHEVERAIERAQHDAARIQGRREPEPKQLELAA